MYIYIPMNITHSRTYDASHSHTQRAQPIHRSCNLDQRIMIAGAGGGGGSWSFNGATSDGGNGGALGYPGKAVNRTLNGYTGDAFGGGGGTASGMSSALCVHSSSIC